MNETVREPTAVCLLNNIYLFYTLSNSIWEDSFPVIFLEKNQTPYLRAKLPN